MVIFFLADLGFIDTVHYFNRKYITLDSFTCTNKELDLKKVSSFWS